MEEKTIKHYSNKHKILLVGEGDFSFSLCLARAFGSATNMVATSLDSEDSLREKYSRAILNVTKLEMLGCTILYQVNALTMNQHTLLHGMLFDRIIFNFPHAGFYCKESYSSQIKLHQALVKGFMESGREMLSEDGEIHVTHKTSHPFCKWEIEKLGEEAGLCLYEQVPFYKYDYQGYSNKRGDGSKCDHKFHVGMCSTFKFTKDPGIPQGPN